MKVTLREKKLKTGKNSLYLDFWPPVINPEKGISTRREFLGIYIFEKPKDSACKLPLITQIILK